MFAKKEKEKEVSYSKRRTTKDSQRPGPQGKPGVQKAMAGGKAAAERMRARRLAYRPGFLYEDLN